MKDSTVYKYDDLSKEDNDHLRFDDVRSAAMAVGMVELDGLTAWLGASLASSTLGDPTPYRNTVGRGIAELGKISQKSWCHMIDLHCHLDLYPQPQEVVLECTKRKMFVLSVTNDAECLARYVGTRREGDQICTALGLHPQLAEQRKHELPLFNQFLPDTKYVGEVGLTGETNSKLRG